MFVFQCESQSKFQQGPLLGAGTHAGSQMDPCTSTLTTSLHPQLSVSQLPRSCMRCWNAADAVWVVREDLQADSFLLLLCALPCALMLGCNTCVPKQAPVVQLLVQYSGTCDSIGAQECCVHRGQVEEAQSCQLGLESEENLSVLHSHLMCGAKAH